MNAFPHSLFISHGGGPMPLLGDPGHRQMVSCLQNIAASIPRPDAILVISAHWEEPSSTITSGSKPALAREVQRLLGNNGIDATLDETRGLDHGVFIPLKIMYPQADIQCV